MLMVSRRMIEKELNGIGSGKVLLWTGSASASMPSTEFKKE
jgi:hypothetical protein